MSHISRNIAHLHNYFTCNMQRHNFHLFFPLTCNLGPKNTKETKTKCVVFIKKTLGVSQILKGRITCVLFIPFIIKNVAEEVQRMPYSTRKSYYIRHTSSENGVSCAHFKFRGNSESFVVVYFQIEKNKWREFTVFWKAEGKRDRGEVKQTGFSLRRRTDTYIYIET